MFQVLTILYFPGKRLLFFFWFKSSFSVSFWFVSGILSQGGRDTGWHCTYEMIKSIRKGHLFKNANQVFL